MDLLTRSAKAGSFKRTSGGIDGRLKCLGTTTFEQPIHQTPANSNLKKILVDQALPSMGTLRLVRFCEFAVQYLHEVVDLIPGAVFDESLTLVPDVGVLTPVGAVWELSEDGTDNVSEKGWAKAQVTLRHLENRRSDLFRGVVADCDIALLRTVTVAMREWFRAHYICARPRCLSNKSAAGDLCNRARELTQSNGWQV